ncbi:unnamed protein product [Gordionus sp. m RMFG-2023]
MDPPSSHSHISSFPLSQNQSSLIPLKFALAPNFSIVEAPQNSSLILGGDYHPSIQTLLQQHQQQMQLQHHQQQQQLFRAAYQKMLGGASDHQPLSFAADLTNLSNLPYLSTLSNLPNQQASAIVLPISSLLALGSFQNNSLQQNMQNVPIVQNSPRDIQYLLDKQNISSPNLQNMDSTLSQTMIFSTHQEPNLLKNDKIKGKQSVANTKLGDNITLFNSKNADNNEPHKSTSGEIKVIKSSLSSNILTTISNTLFDTNSEKGDIIKKEHATSLLSPPSHNDNGSDRNDSSVNSPHSLSSLSPNATFSSKSSNQSESDRLPRIGLDADNAMFRRHNIPSPTDHGNNNLYPPTSSLPLSSTVAVNCMTIPKSESFFNDYHQTLTSSQLLRSAPLQLSSETHGNNSNITNTTALGLACGPNQPPSFIRIPLNEAYYQQMNTSNIQSQNLPNMNPTNINNNLVNSTNIHVHPQHPVIEEAARKREVRLLKNREAAKECRRKKKEYVKCLENRVVVLENQNKALIDELKSLKELYCQKQE